MAAGRAARRRAGCLLAAAIAVAALGACGGGEAGRAPDGRFAVGRARRVFVDRDRGTDAYGDRPAQPDRTLPTLLLYPATGEPVDGAGGAPAILDGAPPAQAGGPFPLFVFAHGYGGVADVYLDLLASIAAEGYVVAAPDFPVTSTLADGGIADYVNQPADLSFVIDEVLRLGSGDAPPLAGLVDGGRVGAGGQSLGGITTWGITRQPCRRDARIDAALPMAGATWDYPGEAFDRGGPPTLIVHGEADDTVPFTSALDAYARIRPPRALLRLPGSGHIYPYVNIGGRTPALQAVIAASIAFLDLELKHERGALDRLRGVASPGIAVIEADGLD